MSKVIGIGGVFLRSKDKPGLIAWYSQVLGLNIEAWGGCRFEHPAAGYAVWAAFDTDTDYFAPSDGPMMINFVVDDLDGVLARAQACGVAPIGRDDADPNGRFAWLMDPSGLKLELWQPRPPTGDPG